MRCGCHVLSVLSVRSDSWGQCNSRPNADPCRFCATPPCATCFMWVMCHAHTQLVAPLHAAHPPPQLHAKHWVVSLRFCSYEMSKDELLAKISLVDAIVIRSATKASQFDRIFGWFDLTPVPTRQGRAAHLAPVCWALQAPAALPLGGHACGPWLLSQRPTNSCSCSLYCADHPRGVRGQQGPAEGGGPCRRGH